MSQLFRVNTVYPKYQNISVPVGQILISLLSGCLDKNVINPIFFLIKNGVIEFKKQYVFYQITIYLPAKFTNNALNFLVCVYPYVAFLKNRFTSHSKCLLSMTHDWTDCASKSSHERNLEMLRPEPTLLFFINHYHSLV